MPTLNKKIQIIPLEDNFRETYQILRDWRYHSANLANTIMSDTYSIANKTKRICQSNPDMQWNEVEADLKMLRIGDLAGKVTHKTINSSFGYCISKEPDFQNNLPGAIRTKVAKNVAQHYKDDVKRGLLKGICSVRNYKFDKMNIYLPSGKGDSKFYIEDDI